MPVSLLIADDHEVVRNGLATILKNQGIDIVAEVSDGEQAVQAAIEHQPDVALLDIRMEGSDGIQALENIRREAPNVGIVMYSTYDNPTYVARSVALGANEYMLKGYGGNSLIESIHRVAKGEAPPSDSILSQVKKSMTMRREGVPDDFPLTARETQVLRHIALGLSNKETGRSLTISVETVKEHVQNILRKINATDRTQAAVWAVKQGLV